MIKMLENSLKRTFRINQQPTNSNKTLCESHLQKQTSMFVRQLQGHVMKNQRNFLLK